jgi:O-antigen/teichoic acid export membrane protein
VRYVLLFALLCAALGSALAEEIVRLIYGAGYAPSARVLAVLVWITPLFAYETYAITRWMVERRPRASLLLMGGHLAAIAVLTPLLALYAGANGAAWAMVIANGLAVAAVPLCSQGEPPLAAPLWKLAAVALAGYGVGSGLLMPWPVRLVAGLGAYLAVAWALRLWTGADWRRVRSVLSREPD